jgi:uncharacterized damage-inducible protein DinB
LVVHLPATVPQVKDEDRTQPDCVGDERELALAFLAFHRDTLRWKIDGLTKEQLLQPHPPSTMTLLGLVRHLAVVEDSWFNDIFLGDGLSDPWASVDWDADRDWEWHSAAEYSVQESIALRETAVAEATPSSRRTTSTSDQPRARTDRRCAGS